jgi:membrane-bound lytic murein transglycosylase D
MVRRRLRLISSVAAFALLAGLHPALAQGDKVQQKPAVKPAASPATTPASTASPAPKAESVKPSAPATPPPAAKAAAKPAPSPPVPKSHKVGKAPAVPNPTLPAGAARQAPDEIAREQVAGDTTQEKLQSGLPDPELRALHDAERVLFPRALPGLEAGWSHKLPDPSQNGLSASGVPDGVAGEAPLADELRLEGKEWLRSLALPNMPVSLNVRVIRYLEFYRDNPRGQAIARTWAQKVGRYTPAMKAVFTRFSLPTDLVYLSLIESGHNPTIFSPAGAAGLWQFIPESGRIYGLTVDRWVDERLDPQRSTEAAARYLSDLRRRFGSWELAMAAYNMGQTGLLKVMRQYNTNDFWRLTEYEAALPWETTLYVPKIQAIAIVMNNRKAFGLSDIAPDAPVSFDTVYVDESTSIEQVAQAAALPVESVRALNPHYLAGRAPPSLKRGERLRWPVYVPTGSGTKVAQALSQAKTTPGSVAPQATSVLVRQGDNLETVAYRYRTTADVLQRLNQIRSDESLTAGSVLLVPALASGDSLLEDREDYVVVSRHGYSFPGREQWFYRVRNGDTVADVSRAFGISSVELVRWNSLDAGANLQADMILQAFVPQGSDLSRVRAVKPSQTQLLIAGSPEFIEFFEAQKGRSRVVVAAQEGDTLSKVGARYGMSVSMMERINRYSRDKALKAGEPVVVYTKRKVSKTELSPDAQASLPPLDLAPSESQASLETDADPQN